MNRIVCLVGNVMTQGRSRLQSLVLFGLAVGITVVLVSLERLILWLLARHTNS